MRRLRVVLRARLPREYCLQVGQGYCRYAGLDEAISTTTHKAFAAGTAEDSATGLDEDYADVTLANK